jgi:hypothetical protein
MDHLTVTHGTVSNVTCTGCGVSWDLPAGPMVSHLDHFAQLHSRCGVTRRQIDVTQTAASMR